MLQDKNNFIQQRNSHIYLVFTLHTFLLPYLIYNETISNKSISINFGNNFNDKVIRFDQAMTNKNNLWETERISNFQNSYFHESSQL
jgi:hypothetical protein